ncbi:MAG: tyrosine-protein phosphatase [Hyphomonadaceae bacterium]|jgi:protein-tyrosine phosphatase|nr:tyrosine-protein phosphatase [Hyphomonadaceae bacterium]
MTLRFIPVDGLRNLRDFGGVPSSHGGMIVSGHLYRAANFASLTDQGRAQLSALGLTALVDLRRRSERDEQPNAVHGLDLITIASDETEGAPDMLAPHLAFMRDGDLTPETARAHMHESYQRFLHYPQHHETFRGAFEHLAMGGGPVAIHCAAGKDRTGVLCALILKVLGAPEEHIVADYLHTNVQPDLDARIVDYAAMAGARFSTVIDPEALRPMVGVEAGYLDTAFDAMSHSFGGWEGYLDSIRVDRVMRERVVARLIV